MPVPHLLRSVWEIATVICSSIPSALASVRVIHGRSRCPSGTYDAWLIMVAKKNRLAQPAFLRQPAEIRRALSSQVPDLERYDIPFGDRLIHADVVNRNNMSSSPFFGSVCSLSRVTPGASPTFMKATSRPREPRDAFRRGIHRCAQTVGAEQNGLGSLLTDWIIGDFGPSSGRWLPLASVV